ncbi:hypothetical protein HYN59_02715 [Flavobacterium album]|uniref:Uncharacterized protein n=2 Tax=Flavobacterium album TaxID=2175091 RepID=A0A2S1QUK0_9FLAO|nr:hypothetical protein HYN59_02715 [Flavobacterium album]
MTFIVTVKSYSQKTVREYFDDGITYAGNEDYQNAASSFKYIVDNHPKDSLYPLALYNVAYVYAAGEDYMNAIPSYERILASDLKEDDLIGGDIMASPYANYKYKASRDLCRIYIAKEDYEKALEYLILSDEKYPYIHFCANKGCSNETELALNYALLYEKTGHKDKAREKLLSYALNGTERILDELKIYLSEEKDVKAKFDRSLKAIESEKKDDYTNYFITFLGAKMYVGWGDDTSGVFDKKQAIKDIKRSDFYKMLEALKN